MEEKINGYTLNLDYYSGKDFYCDGEIEDELLEICKSQQIEKTLRERNEWPILYHLSSARENLLEWYDFNKSESLLEIGAGCGALTGLFSRKMQRVVGIELSKKRSMINAYKNGKFGNAEIYVGNFQEVKIEEKFDYVTLIGVLEYSGNYIADSHPYDAMLKKVKTNLKDGGKLIIAIENKMGLKYWSGAAEDHTGKPFDGLQDYPGINHVRTFTKQELIELLERNGYINHKFYYPMPDYKLPFCVYSDEYLPKAGELRAMQAAFSGDNYAMFDEGVVADMLCKENLFPYFSNSYLVITEKNI